MASRTVMEKGLRLHREGWVTEIPSPRSFRVKGDTGEHHVVVTADVTEAWCDCRSDFECSHIVAALLAIRSEAAATAV